MTSPVHFGFNTQTANTNPFQHKIGDSETEIQNKALREFNDMANQLKEVNINVLVLSGRKDLVTPDSIFPNNWFSHHQKGKLIIYPMLTENRRAERQLVELKQLLKTSNISIVEVVDLTRDEKDGMILEGTGSLVLDRQHKVAFAMESPRTTHQEFNKWCQIMGYEGVFFHAYDAKNFPIYHTNVTMSIGEKFAIVCLKSIKDKVERHILENKLENLGKEIISITVDQMSQFCGNILQLLSNDGESIIIMSERAFSGFAEVQRKILQKYGKIISVQVPTIETVGGGSARCMLAEVFAD